MHFLSKAKLRIGQIILIQERKKKMNIQGMYATPVQEKIRS